MAWTTPRTWGASDVPTADGTLGFNPQIRDNLNVLKTTRGGDGRIPAISSTYFASLSAANITGDKVTLGSSAAFTAKNNFNAGTARVILPVGTDKFVGSPGSKTPGSAWVEADGFHHVDNDGEEWRYTGVLLGTPAGAVVGSVWAEGNDFHYIDSSGEERLVFGVFGGLHADAAALRGSVWIDTDDRLHWINDGAQEFDGHGDIPAHTDTHSDVSHVDTHTDNHGNQHDNVAHVNAHDDVSHQDTVIHADHGDEGAGGHEDSGAPVHFDSHTNDHVNSHTDDHVNTHGNVAHVNTHTNNHTDHGDAHFDQPESLGT
jgi:hypothetical protein